MVVGLDVAMATGKLIRYDELRGYGFIAPDRGAEDVFVHVNDLEMDKQSLVPGMRVEFVVAEGERGLKAIRVRPERPAAQLVPVAAPSSGIEVVSPPVVPDSDTQDDTLCDVLTTEELEHELTEALVTQLPTLTGGDVVAIRNLVVSLASGHQWIEM